uniref:Uncharacterized protein n=1 Tax=Pararge aegeria TaxID=116150 RepID=S4PFN5_9NEOP
MIMVQIATSLVSVFIYLSLLFNKSVFSYLSDIPDSVPRAICELFCMNCSERFNSLQSSLVLRPKLISSYYLCRLDKNNKHKLPKFLNSILPYHFTQNT